MEHIVCTGCGSEYDLTAITAAGLIPHNACCEVCGAVLKGWVRDQEAILIMTKRGSDTQ